MTKDLESLASLGSMICFFFLISISPVCKWEAIVVGGFFFRIFLL